MTVFQKVIDTPVKPNSAPFFMSASNWGTGSPGLRSREGESTCDNLEGRELGLDVASCTALVYFRHPSRSRLLSAITLSISEGVWLVSDCVWVWQIDALNTHTHIHPKPSSSPFPTLYSTVIVPAAIGTPTGIGAKLFSDWIEIFSEKQSRTCFQRGGWIFQLCYFSVWCNSF